MPRLSLTKLLAVPMRSSVLHASKKCKSPHASKQTVFAEVTTILVLHQDSSTEAASE